MRHMRLIALTLTLMASMFMLAHAIMPHSHHDGVICFSLEEIMHRHHCSDQQDDTHNCCEQHKKGCHHQAHAEDCNLQELILRQQDNTHDDILPCANCLSLAYILYSLNEFYLEAPQFGERFRQKPYLVNYTPPFVGSIKSLRAPPVSYFLA